MVIINFLFAFCVGAFAAEAPDFQTLPNSFVQWQQTDLVDLPGPKSDGSTTLLWINGLAHMFYNFWSMSDQRAYSVLATGPDLYTLKDEQVVNLGDDFDFTHRWFESVLRGPSGDLYAFYHSEEKSPCSFYYKTPEIGLAKSTDQGRTWKNLGIIVKVADEENDCTAANGFFSNGNGDFSAIYDRTKNFIYLVYTNYPMVNQVGEQGIAFARLSADDLDQPVGKVLKWHSGSYSEPGIDGLATSIFKPAIDFRAPNPDGFWGPSLHYNTYLHKYVMLLSRTQNGNSTNEPFPSEGIYLSTNDDVADPAGWTTPVKIVNGGHWYPQFFGTGAAQTSDEMGQDARFFMEGGSFFLVRFAQP